MFPPREEFGDNIKHPDPIPLSCYPQEKPTVAILKTQMPGLLAVNGSATKDMKRHEVEAAVVQIHLRLGRRSQLTESIQRPQVGQKDTNKGDADAERKFQQVQKHL